MAFTYGFYNSFKGDRKYDAIQVSEMFDGILKDGIIPSQGQLFAVTTADNGMQINVGTGRAWFEHTWSKNDSVMVLTVPQSDITRDRWDAVVLEVNHSDDVRANAIKIEQGVAAVNPSKPNLLNTDKIKQFPLAYILVKAGTDEIKAEHIENAVGLSPTVFATGVLETAPLDALWEQWKGEFNTWFSAIKLQLSGDIVTNLQRQIDELKVNAKIMELYGLSGNVTPNDVFNNIWYRLRMIMNNKALFVLRLQLSDGSPLVGFTVSGITDEDGTASVSDENGTITGFVDSGTKTLSITGYADLSTVSKSYTFVKGESYSDEWTFTTTNFLAVTSTKSVKFSPRIKRVEYSVVGGGGGGGAGNGGSGGGGGGGGYCNNGSMIPTPNQSYTITVGSGGSGGTGSNTVGDSNSYANGTNGTSGGASSFSGTTANGGNFGYAGGSGGSGNGNGGNGATCSINHGASTKPSVSASSSSSGKSSTSKYYSSLTDTALCGGGGGGGGHDVYVSNTYGSASSDKSASAGGSPNGGAGGGGGGNWVARGANGKAYGGGGGGGDAYHSSSEHSDYSESSKGTGSGGSGGSGVVTLRMYSTM